MLKLSEYLAVAVAATIKFVGGPIAGVAFNLKWWETTLFSAIGMMITVILVIYGGGFLGNLIQKFRSEKPRKISSKTTRIGVKVKSKLGLWGIALLTPFIFTPIVGSFLALNFRFKKSEIVWKMLLCALFAGFIQTCFFYFMKIWFLQ